MKRSRDLVLSFPVTVFAHVPLRTGNIPRQQLARPILQRVAKAKRSSYKYIGINLTVKRVEPGPNVVNAKLTTCPRCGQAIVDEGFAYYCKFGCTRTFPKLGALLSDRYEHERMVASSGHELDKEGSKYHDGITVLYKKRKSVEKQRAYNATRTKKRRVAALKQAGLA